MHLSPKSHLLNPIKGQTMILTVLTIGGTLLSISLISGLLMLFQIRQSGDLANSTKALFAADAGVEWYLKNQGLLTHPAAYDSIIGSTSFSPVPFTNGAAFEVITESDLVAKVIGRAGNSKRAFLISVGSGAGGGASPLNLCLSDNIDAMLVVDESHNFSNNLIIKNALKDDFIDNLSFADDASQSRVGLITVYRAGFNIRESISSQQLNNNEIRIKNQINNIASDLRDPPYDEAYMYLGIRWAKSELTSFGDRDDAQFKDFMIVITDSSHDRPAQNPINAKGEANLAKNAGITIFVIGVGVDADTADFYEQEVSSGLGYYIGISNYNKLGDALKSNVLGC